MHYTVVVSIVIEPLSKIPISALHAFLSGHGHDPAIIDWKYCDSDFNRNRERGLACVDDHGRLLSFIGLIPFTVMHNGKAVDAAWCCDWYRALDASGPLGVMLIQHSLKAYPLIYSLGGGEMTKAIMGRLSRVTIPTAGVELYKPVRIGGAIYALRKATAVNVIPSVSTINNVKLPIREQKQNKAPLTVRFVASLPPTFDELLVDRVTDAHLPAYDLQYLRWLLDRCPSITGGACLVSRGEESIGAVLFWHPVADKRFWRISLLPCRRNYGVLDAAVTKTIRHIRDNGGWLISLLASRLDIDLLELAKRNGFYQSTSRRPLYILTRNRQDIVQELEQLSYLDTDYAYRFPAANM
jgi:hypothetical protein